MRRSQIPSQPCKTDPGEFFPLKISSVALDFLINTLSSTNLTGFPVKLGILTVLGFYPTNAIPICLFCVLSH